MLISRELLPNPTSYTKRRFKNTRIPISKSVIEQFMHLGKTHFKGHLKKRVWRYEMGKFAKIRTLHTKNELSKKFFSEFRTRSAFFSLKREQNR